MVTGKNRGTLVFDDQGTFTVWALCLCLMLFLLAGISVDVWRAFDARRSLADMADTAARSGASEINVFERQFNSVTVLDPDLARSATEDSLDVNGLLNGVTLSSQDIDVNSATNEVSVEITSQFSFFLLGFLPGASDVEMIANATARPFEG